MLETEIDRVWLTEPEEVQRIRWGIIESGAGSGGQSFSVLVHLEAYLMLVGADVIYRFLRVSQYPDMELAMINRITKEFLSATFNAFEFLTDLGMTNMHQVGDAYIAALDDCKTKEDYVELTGAMMTYLFLHLPRLSRIALPPKSTTPSRRCPRRLVRRWPSPSAGAMKAKAQRVAAGSGRAGEQLARQLKDMIKGVRLTPAQRRIAQTLIDREAQAAFLSSMELAELANVSQPSVTRFAVALGFEGYLEMRRHLRFGGEDNGAAAESAANRYQQAALAEARNLTQLAAQLADEELIAELGRGLAGGAADRPRPPRLGRACNLFRLFRCQGSSRCAGHHRRRLAGRRSARAGGDGWGYVASRLPHAALSPRDRQLDPACAGDRPQGRGGERQGFRVPAGPRRPDNRRCGEFEPGVRFLRHGAGLGSRSPRRALRGIAEEGRAAAGEERALLDPAEGLPGLDQLFEQVLIRKAVSTFREHAWLSICG